MAVCVGARQIDPDDRGVEYRLGSLSVRVVAGVTGRDLSIQGLKSGVSGGSYIDPVDVLAVVVLTTLYRDDGVGGGAEGFVECCTLASGSFCVW